jgi:lipid-A-disaccharide synthase
LKYYLIAGERSGDMHASNLMKQLKIQDPAAEFRFWGGEQMQAVGGELVTHYREMAFMGFVEVAASIFKISAFLKQCKQDILTWKPDVVILVDYAGFNMRIAKFAKEKGFKTFYYISPKIWAWNQGRVHGIKKSVDRMFVIMPFEKDFYQRFDYQTDYIGNPVSDSVNAHQVSADFLQKNGLGEKPIIAVLPGSRKQEIENMLRIMLQVMPDFPEQQFVVAGVSTFSPEFYAQFTQGTNIKILYEQTYDLLSHAEAALVTSGTATLETALFNVPQIVCYKTSAISYAIGKMVIKVKYISLVNLIADKEVVKELIQDELNPKNISGELKKLLFDKVYRQQQLNGYAEIKAKLGTANTAEQAAKLMVGYMKEE